MKCMCVCMCAFSHLKNKQIVSNSGDNKNIQITRTRAKNICDFFIYLFISSASFQRKKSDSGRCRLCFLKGCMTIVAGEVLSSVVKSCKCCCIIAYTHSSHSIK